MATIANATAFEAAHGAKHTKDMDTWAANAKSTFDKHHDQLRNHLEYDWVEK